MANNEELKAMGIIEEPMTNNINKIENTVAVIIKGLAMFEAIAVIIVGIFLVMDSIIGIAIAIVIGGIISAVFIYALGEIIQLLEDIKNK